MALRRHLLYGACGAPGGVSSAACRLRQLRWWRPAPYVSRGAALQVRGGGGADEAHRRLSGQVRPEHTPADYGASAETLHQRTLAHTEDKERPAARTAAYQPRSRRTAGMADRAHPRPTHHRRRNNERLRSDYAGYAGKAQRDVIM